MHEKGRYDYAKFKKTTMLMQLPFLELCKNHNLTFKYDFLDVLSFKIVSSLTPSEIEVVELDARTTLS